MILVCKMKVDKTICLSGVMSVIESKQKTSFLLFKLLLMAFANPSWNIIDEVNEKLGGVQFLHFIPIK